VLVEETGHAEVGSVETAQRAHSWSGLEEIREPLRCFLSRHCRDENEIDDVIQDTFVRAARYRSKLADAARLRSWAMRIALNVLSDARRRAQRLQLSLTEEGAADGIEAREPVPELCVSEPRLRLGSWVIGKQAALDHLAAALSGLQADDRRVLGSFYGGTQSCRQTAQDCAIPQHLVKVRLFRARKRLLRAMRRRFAMAPGVQREGLAS
jgi:RNA polymerase sigma factor (sigma-70 family)